MNIVKRRIIHVVCFKILFEKYPFHILLTILFYTGINIGEMVSLTQGDIDFIKNFYYSSSINVIETSKN